MIQTLAFVLAGTVQQKDSYGSNKEKKLYLYGLKYDRKSGCEDNHNK
jgi:hypothetical protein